MTTPKSAPTAQTNVELIKFANAQASFICEAMLGVVAEDGNVYNKVVLVLVKRNSENKAEQTLRYWIDIPIAKVLMHDLWTGGLTAKYDEFKRRGNVQRALKVSPTDDGGYQVSVMNAENGDKQWLYFDMSRLQARALARTVLDYLSHYELASMIQAVSGRANKMP